MQRFVIALGFFDSLHIGHIDLLNKTKALAQELSAEPLILTFDDSFFPALNKETKQVFTLSEREKLLKETGVRPYIAASGEDFFKASGEEFLSRLTAQGVVGIIAGEDYRYGHNAAWDAKDLYAFCQKNNIKLVIAPTVMKDGRKVSSGDIRNALIMGDIKKANALLGRDYTISGEVARGRGEGSKIGIPTANIYPAPIKQLPKEGVYKTYTNIDGRKYSSVTNVGVQPTFQSSAFSVETLIVNFVDMLYGKIITIGFLDRIRDIIRFDSKEALIQQISKDIEEIT